MFFRFIQSTNNKIDNSDHEEKELDQKDDRTSDWDTFKREVFVFNEKKWSNISKTWVRQLHIFPSMNHFTAMTIAARYTNYGALYLAIMSCETEKQKLLFLHNEFPYYISPWQSESLWRAMNDQDWIGVEFIPENWKDDEGDNDEGDEDDEASKQRCPACGRIVDDEGDTD